FLTRIHDWVKRCQNRKPTDLDQGKYPAVGYIHAVIEKESAMYSNIICAVDGSDLSKKALTAAVSLAQKTGGSLTIATVTHASVIIAPGAEVMMIDTGAIIADLEKVKAESAKSVLSEARALVQSSGLVPKEVHISNSPAADGILRAAQEAGA